MALGKLWTIAFRDLGRNRRRSGFTMLAVAIGLALTIVMSGMIANIFDQGLQDNIRLETGHLQLRAASYEPEKVSLQWDDLLADPDGLTANAAGMSEVVAAAPVLWATGILNTADDSIGLKVTGIDTTSAIHAPIRDTIVAGAFLTPDDRNGIVIGKRLADDLGITIDQQVSLSVINADGQPEEGFFTIRGLFSTGIPSYDQGTLFLPLNKAQAFTRTDGHASAIVMLLQAQEQADTVAARFQLPGIAALTWQDLNSMMIDLLATGQVVYNFMYGIVLLIVAVVIANTLLMAVFERIREMGILAALGMKRRQIMLLYVMEAAVIGLVGAVIGIGLGAAGVAYLAKVGIYIGDVGASVEGFALGTSMYAQFDLPMVIWLTIATLALTLLGSLYPAWFAGSMEPAEALHSS